MWGRISALVMLALGLVKTLLLRFVRRDALGGFEERYGSEGILGVSGAESRILQQPGTCIACGLCDAKEGPRVAASRTGYRGMMSFALSGVRSLTNYDAVAHSLSEVPDEAFREAEALCPVGVPFVELSRLVRGHAERQKVIV